MKCYLRLLQRHPRVLVQFPLDLDPLSSHRIALHQLHFLVHLNIVHSRYCGQLFR